MGQNILLSPSINIDVDVRLPAVTLVSLFMIVLFGYNRANLMVKSGDYTYVYDASRLRVKSMDKKGTQYSFYSKNGKLLFTEFSGDSTNYIYLLDKLIAKQTAFTVAEENDTQQHYRPFGETIEAPKDDIGYTGHKFDTSLGLGYMQQRYYDPVIGRFYSNDPVGYTAENLVMSFNRYLYVNNNPYKYVRHEVVC